MAPAMLYAVTDVERPLGVQGLLQWGVLHLTASAHAKLLLDPAGTRAAKR
jgi:hypothetical protein